MKLFTTGAGLLLVLMIFPGGVGGIIYDIRDAGLRRFARRRGIHVPSLVADFRVDADDAAPPDGRVPTVDDMLGGAGSDGGAGDADEPGRERAEVLS